MNRKERRANPIEARIESHEKECKIRYENIEKRLDAGSQRFVRLENMIWGLYGIIITTSILGKVL